MIVGKSKNGRFQNIGIYSDFYSSVPMTSQLVNVAQSIFQTKINHMPLNNRENILILHCKPQAKFNYRQTPSPGFHTTRLEDDRILARMTDQFNLRSPRSREGNSRKKSLFSSQVSKALFKEAKKVDINDPRQTFLPPKKVNPKSRVSKDTRTDGRKFSGEKDQLHHLHIDRNVLNMYVRKESQACLEQKDRLSLSELHFSDETKEEEVSLTKLVFFGDQESIEFQLTNIQKRISRGEEVQCRKLLRQLSGDETNESSESNQ